MTLVFPITVARAAELARQRRGGHDVTDLVGFQPTPGGGLQIVPLTQTRCQHTFQVLAWPTDMNMPCAVQCSRCGRTWDVVP